MKPRDPAPIDPAEPGGDVPTAAGATVPAPDPSPETVAIAHAQDVLSQVEQIMRVAVSAMEQVLRLGAAEKVEGLTPDLVLANLGRMTYADRTALLTTADTIADLPWLGGAWERGEVSYSQVRRICAAAAKRSKEQRGWLDERLASTAENHDGLDGYAPDDLVTEVYVALDELDAARQAEKAEDRAAEQARLILLPQLTGGGKAIVDEPDPARECRPDVAGACAVPRKPAPLEGFRRSQERELATTETLEGAGFREARSLPTIAVSLSPTSSPTPPDASCSTPAGTTFPRSPPAPSKRSVKMRTCAS